VCGIFGFTGSPDRELCSNLEAALRHRGPDGSKSVVLPSATLGATRLAIDDPERGEQPVEVGSCIVVLNGEVYNARDLARLVGRKLGTHCDTEAVAHLLRALGPEVIRDLDGMFALAVADAREGTPIVLARDPLGIKPLYYGQRRGEEGVVFASELGALLPLVERYTLDLDYLSTYLALRYPLWSRDSTPYRGVICVAPGTVVRMDSGGIHSATHRTWCPLEWVARTGGPTTPDNVTLEDVLRAAVSRCVRHADVPVAVLLSGGLDSSVVAMLTSGVAGPVAAFTLRYECRAEDKRRDLDCAREAARCCGVELHEITMTWKDLKEHVDDIAVSMGEPFGGVPSMWFLARGVAEAGYKIAITGDGADELFGSYKIHRVAAQRRSESPASWFHEYFLFDREERRELLGVDYRLELLPWTDEHPTDVMLKFELEYGLPGNVLRYGDRLGMAHGVEIRPVYLMHEVVRYVALLPPEDRIRVNADGSVETKRLLRRVACDIGVPPAVVERPKVGFVPPLDEWLWDDEGWVRERLDRDRVKCGGVLDPEAVTRAVDRYYGGDRSDFGARVWTLIMLQAWIENVHQKM
jgi:asparagine synthase (glutamine-hydrolysing)